jgi:hypothetical protein
VAGADPTVDIVDSYFYKLRGQLPTKSPFYGPIRVVLPSAAEIGQGIAVKVFGLTSEGLVVIDVMRTDIDNAPALAALRAAALRR